MPSWRFVQNSSTLRSPGSRSWTRKAFAACSGILLCNAPSSAACCAMLPLPWEIAVLRAMYPSYRSGLPVRNPYWRRRRNGLSPAAGSKAGGAIEPLVVPMPRDHTARSLQLRNCFKKSSATHNVGGVESLGALLAFELHRIALVQGLVSVLLDSGEMNEDIFSSRTLDEPVSFGSVEPLHHAIFLQANSFSQPD